MSKTKHEDEQSEQGRGLSSLRWKLKSAVCEALRIKQGSNVTCPTCMPRNPNETVMLQCPREVPTSKEELNKK